jgi:hypothetical protein
MNYIALAAVLVTVFLASLLIEGLLGRSRKEFLKPGGAYVFFGIFIPGMIGAYLLIDPDSPYLISEYVAVAGIAALVMQCTHGVKLSGADKHAT